MTGAEAVARIKQELGFIEDSVHDANILARLQEAQDDLETGKTLPDFLFTSTPVLTAVDQFFYDKPAGFIRLLDQNTNPVLFFLDDTTTELTRLPVVTQAQAVANFSRRSTPGAPQVLAVYPTTFLVLPPADKVYTLFVDYYKAADAISLSGTNAWLGNKGGKWWLIGEAGRSYAGSLRDASALQVFTDMANRWRAAVFGEIVAGEDVGGPIALGEDN